MDKASGKTDLSDYQTVLSAFVELRGRGIAVSAQDLEVLKSWAEDQLPTALIIQTLETISLENQQHGKRFGNSLKALDRTIRRAVRDSQDY